MRVPMEDSQQVQPQGLGDAHVNLENVGAGEEAIAGGIDRAAGGLGELSDHLQRAQMQANHQAADNMRLQWRHNTTTITDGSSAAMGAPASSGASATPGAPLPSLQLQQPQLGASLPASATAPTLGTPQLTAPLPYADGTSPHEPATGPTVGTVVSLSDPESGLAPQGYFNTRGQDASKREAATLQALYDSRDDIAAAAPNDRARQLFLEQTGEDLENLRGQVTRHAYQQGQAALQSTAAANMQASFGAINAAVGRANNVSQAFSAAAVEMKPVEQSLRRVALTPEEGDAKVGAYQQQVYEGLAQHYIAQKDPKSAQAVLDAQKPALLWGRDGAARFDQLQNSVTALQGQDDAEGQAQQLLDAAKLPSGTYDTAKLAQSALDAMDGKTEQQASALRSAVAARQSLVNDVNSGAAANHFSAALSAYQQHYNLNDIPADTATWMQASDPKGWKAIVDEDQRHQAEVRAQAAGQKTQETPAQLQAYYELKDTYRGLSPDDLAKTTSAGVISDAAKVGLSTKRAGELADFTGQLRGQAQPGAKGLTPSQENTIVDALDKAGFTTHQNGLVRVKPEALDLRRRLEDQVVQEQASLRGASTHKDKNFLLDGQGLRDFMAPMLTPTVTQPHWYGDDKAPAITAPGYQSRVVPQQDADQISHALEQSGQEASPENIRRVYDAHGGGTGPSGPQASSALTPVDDLAKDPQALSMMHPAAAGAVRRLAAAPGADFDPHQGLPRAQLRPPARKPIVLPEVKLASAAKKGEAFDETVKGMKVAPGDLADALQGAK